MSQDSWTFRTSSPEETELFGRALYALLPPGALVALYGDLGSGKTCLVRGLTQAHGSAEFMHSPTFTIVNQYPGEQPFYHLDLYRLNSPTDLLDLEVFDLFESASGVCAVEWAERAGDHLPKRRLDIECRVADEETREYTLTNHGLLQADFSVRLAAATAPKPS